MSPFVRSLFRFALCVCPLSSPSRAADLIPCAPEAGKTYAVAGVIDGETLKLDTGDELKLTGVLAPGAPREGTAPSPDHEAAVAFLKEKTLGKRIEVRVAFRPRDRYGRLMGHVLVSAADGAGEWLEEALIRAGHARVFGLEDRGACEATLLRAEDNARTARRGLWANEIYRLRDAASLQELWGLRGTFQIVEGRIDSVAIRGARAYLNFSPDWSHDFTVIAGDSVFKGDGLSSDASREERSAAKRSATAKLTALQGKRVRVRGWVRIRNGPMIEIDRIEDVEQLEP